VHERGGVSSLVTRPLIGEFLAAQTHDAHNIFNIFSAKPAGTTRAIGVWEFTQCDHHYCTVPKFTWLAPTTYQLRIHSFLKDNNNLDISDSLGEYGNLDSAFQFFFLLFSILIVRHIDEGGTV